MPWVSLVGFQHSLVSFLYLNNKPLDPAVVAERVRACVSPQTNLNTSPKSEPTLELISRAAPSVEAHHPLNRSWCGKKFQRKADKKTLNNRIEYDWLNKNIMQNVLFILNWNDFWWKLRDGIYFLNKKFIYDEKKI